MNTLSIIVPGKGRIPRLGSIGPKLDPFEATIEVIEAIVRAPHTPGATFVNPVTSERTVLTRSNYRIVFDKFSRDLSAETSPVIKPAVDQPEASATDPEPVEEANIVEDARCDAKETVKTEAPTKPEPIVEADPVPEKSVETEDRPADPVEEVPVIEAEGETKVDQPAGFKRITKPDDNRRGNNQHRKH